MMHRADLESLKHVFNKYASVTVNGKKYMTPKNFVVDYLHLLEAENHNENSVNLIADVVDSTKDGYISLEEFIAFEGLLCAPDALYATAFQLFDQNGNGYINFEEFKNVYSATVLNDHFPFNFESPFIKLHFGADKTRLINYSEFTQIIHDFHEEHALQAFNKFDLQKNGTISAMDFNQIMIILKSYLLTQFVRENLAVVALQGERQRRISFSYFSAFISLLNNMELVKKVYHSLSRGNNFNEVNKEQFLDEAQQYCQLTPLEIDLLFQLTELLRKDGKLTYSEIQKIAPIRDGSQAYKIQAKLIQETVEKEAAGKGRTVLISVFEQLYRFVLGGVAGALGATAVYPIDLVKTRMQNQRSGSMVGEVMYKGSFDCFKKVVRFEGFLGLYRGLGPQLLGVAPEKAIKLTMNDFMKDQLTPDNGNIPLWAECLSGGVAGGCQVIFTNPLEIVKIRLQVAGEIATTKKVSALHHVRELGFLGLYKGARACFLRDIPFSAIYFPAYNHLKMTFSDEDGINNPTSLLISATLAGAPAAFLCTPADVIKTRLQVVARTGQTTYSGVFDAARKIWREEGGRAFWKGGPARIFRSSPQFGVTLFAYEMLQRILYVDFGGRKLSGHSPSTRTSELLPSNPDHIGGYKLAQATFEGIESKFGLCLPKYKMNLNINPAIN